MPVSKGTVSTYFSNPPQRPRPNVLEAFAKVFDVPVSDLEEAATFTGNEPFVPDRSSDLLTPPQRTAVNEIIRLLADGNRKAGEQGERNTSPMNQAGDDADSVTEANRGRLEHGQQPVPNLAEERRRRDKGPAFGHPGLGDLGPGLIADRGHSEGKRLADEADRRGEESQDPDDAP